MTTRRQFVLLGAAGALLTGCDKLSLPMLSGKASFQGVDITGADYRYALPDQDGKMRTPEDFKGKVTAVFFGYVQCPDVCPTTLAELAQVKKLLGPDGERVQAVFITVDPERDTPELLKAYVQSFDPTFLALRGSLEQTMATAKDFKVFFAKAPGKTPESYTVDHSAGTYLFDAQGRVRLFERYGAGAQVLASDVKALLASG
ncbi:SCO1 protein [Burkholderiaceae bacterium]|nr:SCO1 protein [Burkholderiaceae bacterium]